MSGSATSRMRGFGGTPSWAPAVPARRAIDPYHIAFARERRPRVSWQHLAAQLGVTAEDLRQAVEGSALPAVHALAVAEPRGPAAPPMRRPAIEAKADDRGRRNVIFDRPKPLGLVGGTMEHRALALLIPGPARPRDVAAALDRTPNYCAQLFATLRAKRLAQSAQPGFTKITDAGRAELERLS